MSRFFGTQWGAKESPSMFTPPSRAWPIFIGPASLPPYPAPASCHPSARLGNYLHPSHCSTRSSILLKTNCFLTFDFSFQPVSTLNESKYLSSIIKVACRTGPRWTLPHHSSNSSEWKYSIWAEAVWSRCLKRPPTENYDYSLVMRN